MMLLRARHLGKGAPEEEKPQMDLGAWTSPKPHMHGMLLVGTHRLTG